MPTGAELFGDPNSQTKTAGQLFGEDRIEDALIDHNDMPSGDENVLARPDYRFQYDPVFRGDVPADEALSEAQRIQAKEGSTPEEYEEETARAINSAFYADWLQMEYPDAFDNHDRITHDILGEDNPVTAKQRLGKRYQNGLKQTEAMDLGYALLTTPGPVDQDQYERILKLQASLSTDDLADMRNLFEQMAGSTLEQLPTTIEAIKASPKGAVPGGVLGALVAIGVGALIPAPEEIVSIPAGTIKGAKWGGGIAAANRIRQLEAGSMYLELLELEDADGNKIDPNLAKMVSHTVGAINGGVELVEWGIILSTFGIGTKVFERASAKVTSKFLVEKTMKELLLRKGLSYAGAMTAEVGQEIWQESNNILFGELAKAINNEQKGTNFTPVTGQELLDRYLEITKESYKGFALMLAPGTMVTTAKEAITQRKTRGKDAITAAQKQAPPEGEKYAIRGLTPIKPSIKTESAFDEMGEVDPVVSQQAYDLAKKEELGITSDRDVAEVVKDEEGNVIGAIFTAFDQETNTFDMDVVVSKEHQGKGIASALTDSVIEQFESDEFMQEQEAVMEVRVTNPQAKPILERRGFAVKETLSDGTWIMERRAEEVVPKFQQPFTQTLKEYMAENKDKGLLAHADHLAMVREAIRDGRVVSDEVLRDYPALREAMEQHKAIQEIRAKERSAEATAQLNELKQIGVSPEKALAMTPEQRKQALSQRDTDVDEAIKEVEKRAKRDKIDIGEVEKVDEEMTLDWNNPEDRAGLEAHGITEQEFNDAKEKGITWVKVAEHYTYKDPKTGKTRSGIKLFRGHTARDVFHEYGHALKRQGKATKDFIGTEEQYAEEVADVLTGNSTKAIAELMAEGNIAGLDMMSELGDGAQFNIRTKNGTEVDLAYEVQRAQETKNDPKVIEFWNKVYATAKKLTPAKILEVKKGGKLGDVAVIHLTRNCQRVNFLKIMKRLKMIPKSVREVSCYAGRIGAGACYKDRSTYSKRTAKWGAEVVAENSVAEKPIELATRENLRKMLENPKNRAVIEKSEFVRLGQAGDDSHAIYHGLVRDLLEMTRELGYKMEGKFVFVTSAYAPTTAEMYKELAQYSDMFVIHVTESGYFSYQEILNRFAEFVKATNAGLNVKMRVITNKDLISVAEDKEDIYGVGPLLTEEEAFLFQIIQENDLNNIVLETPFHNDFHTGRSDPTGEYKAVCCETGVCASCGAKCLTRQGKKRNIKVEKLQTGPAQMNIRQTENIEGDGFDSNRDKKADEAAEKKLFEEEKAVDTPMTPEDQSAIEAMEQEIAEDDDIVIEPNLYIGNVTQRMKKKMGEAMGVKPEDVSGFKEGAFPTKRTPIKMTRRKAKRYLQWLEADLLRRLEANEVNSNSDLAKANADWGDIVALREALGLPKGKRPFSVVRAGKHTMKEIKNITKRIYEAIRPTEDANMTVGDVLGATMRKAAQAARRAYTVGSRDGIAKAKKRYEELKMREKARKALKKRIERAVKVIKKKPPSTVDFFYRKAIEEIQASIDPVMRFEKTRAKRQRMREFLARATEEQKRDFPKKLAQLLDAKDLSEFTVEELEDVAQQIKDLIYTGKVKQKARVAIEISQREKRVNKALDAAGGAPVADTGPRGIDFSSEGLISAIKNAYVWTLRIPRLLDWLDGHKGEFGGVWHRMFYDTVNEATNDMLTAVDERHKGGTKKMEELGITMNELAETDDFSSLQEGLMLTKEQQMGLYAAVKNKQAIDAVVHGNKISEKAIDAIIGNLDKKYKDMADWIIQDYANNYDRVREVFIQAKNEDLGQEEFYTPMVRLEKNGEVSKKEMVDQLLQRHGLKKAYTEKGFTIDRKKIAPEHQMPIDIRLVSTWQAQTQKQEHFIHFNGLTMELHKMLQDKRITAVLNEKLGSQGKTVLENYVNRIAQPTIYKSYDMISKGSRALRRNVAMGYLAYNLMTMTKQVPSLLLYSKDAGVGHLLSSALELMSSPREVWDRVREMDPQIKNAFVERELEDLRKLAEQSGQQDVMGKINHLIAMVGDKGMIGIRFLDGIVRTIGWNAVYQKNKQLGLSDAESARMAQNATLRTQPASSPKDIAQLYATNEFINWFTMFTNQLNNIWNISTYDTFAYWSSGKYQDAAMTSTSIAVNAMVLWMLVNKRMPEDEEDFMDMGLDQFINMLPLINNGAMVGKRGWGSVSPPPLTTATEIAKVLSATNKKKQAARALSSTLVLTGIPVTAIKRGGKFLQTGEPVELFGGAGGGKKKASML
jgi:ribosomal protein S18 acetylase RimI-like enzyme